MKESITQESDYGCGIACYAFVLEISFHEAVEQLGKEQSESNRFWVKDLTKALNESWRVYKQKYVKPHIEPLIYQEGTVVLIGRSKEYPAGHYLVRHNNSWMDPWINLPKNKNIYQARSGFRKVLPGIPKYAILPVSFLGTSTTSTKI